MTTLQELESFSRFARSKVIGQSQAPSLDELFDLWRLENPATELADEDLAAVSAALNEFADGDRGRPAGELTAELRSKLGR